MIVLNLASHSAPFSRAWEKPGLPSKKFRETGFAEFVNCVILFRRCDSEEPWSSAIGSLRSYRTKLRDRKVCCGQVDPETCAAWACGSADRSNRYLYLYEYSYFADFSASTGFSWLKTGTHGPYTSWPCLHTLSHTIIPITDHTAIVRHTLILLS